MSVVINNEPFEIYYLDTKETILERYCIHTVDPDQSLPRYRKIKILKESSSIIDDKVINNVSVQYISEKPYIVNLLENSIITIESLYQLFFNTSTGEHSIEVNLFEEDVFKNDMNNLLTIARQNSYEIKDIKEMIFLYAILTHSLIQDVNEEETNEDSYKYITGNIELFALGKYLSTQKSGYLMFYEEYQREWYAIRGREKRIREDQDKINILDRYDSTQIIGSFISPIKETQTRYDGEFEMNVDVYEILNQMIPDRDVPFLKISKFYKILNNFTVPLQWLEEEDETNDTLRMYVMKNKIESETNIKTPKAENYVSIKIDQIGDTDKSSFKYKYSILSDEGDLVIDSELILTRFFNKIREFNEIPKQMTISKTFGKGYILFKGIPLSREIIYDFALNDPIVSQIMIISEIFKIEKIKGGIRFYLLNNIICNAYLTIIESPTSEEVKNFRGSINIGDYVIRININAMKGKDKSNNKIDTGIKRLSQCLMYMFDMKDKLFFDYYRQYLPNIDDIAKIKSMEEDKNETLKKIFPEIFVSGYGRQCQNRQPTIISDDEASSTNEDVMLFPRTPSEGRQGYYVCRNSKTHRYVGYIENTLSNKDEYGILPCCFKIGQTGENELRYKYENDKINILGQNITDVDVIEEKFGTDTIIKTHKILGSGRYGVLPKNIVSLLTSIDNDVLLGKSRYLRRGVEYGPTSVLLCMYDSLKINIKDKQIANLADYNLTSQNMLFPKDVVKIINNKDYIDPVHFVALLENIFGVNIIIFCRDKIDNIDGSFCSPKYKKYLIINEKKETYKNTVILFCTTGSESNRDIPHPQTELIVLERNFSSISKVNSKDIVKTFNTSSSLIKQLMIMYQGTMNILYENIQFMNKIMGQQEDSYGKIRSLIFASGIIVYITPIAPQDIDRFEKKMVIYSTKQDIKRHSTLLIQTFFKDETNISNIQKVLYTNPAGEFLLIGYSFTIDRSKGFIYSESSDDTDEITKNVFSMNKYEYPCPLGVSESLLDRYNKFIRLSNMLTSYAYYLFSKKNIDINNLIYLENSDEFNEKIREYVNLFSQYIVVKDGHQYTNLNRSLNIKNTSFVKDKEYLIVETEEIKKRILYNVYLLLKNDIETMTKYKSKKYIPNFYTTPKDFNQSEHFTIYYTKKEFALYNIDPVLIYKCYTLPPDSFTEIFFLSNRLIDNGSIFLVQRCSSVENSIFTYRYYKDNHINTSDRVSEIDSTSVNLKIYTYQDDDIQENNILVNGEFETVNILIFKIQSQLFYYCLMRYE